MSDQNLEFGGPDTAIAWNPMRSELRTWFWANAKPLAPAYEAAVEFLAKPTFPGRVRFIAHAVRDISNRLIDVLEPQPKAPRVQYEGHLDDIQASWQSLDEISQPGTASSSADRVIIPRELAMLIDDLVRRHRERRNLPSAHNRLFQYLVRGSLSPPASIELIVKEFGKTAKWFVAHAHFTAEAPSPVEERDLQGKFKSFEGAIFGMIGTYFTGADAIDEILKQANR